MSLYLAFDTSNYTTSVALYDTEEAKIYQKKKLLPVKQGEKGIRQSDAVFHHTRQLSPLLAELLREYKEAPETGGAGKGSIASLLSAVGASDRPRRVAGSYMPCFMVGHETAVAISALSEIPLYSFSHQEGHIAAALYSADRLDLVGKEFLAFHVSGGTTESLLVKKGKESPFEATLLGTSTDLKAGMAIDRVGVALGLPFPAGPSLEKLALQSEKTYRIHPSVKGLNCSLSGLENQCKKQMEEGTPPEDTAKYCLSYIAATLSAMADAALEAYPGRHLVFSGGVMSNSFIKASLQQKFDCSFAEPLFSADNAAGIAVLTALSATTW